MNTEKMRTAGVAQSETFQCICFGGGGSTPPAKPRRTPSNSGQGGGAFDIRTETVCAGT